MRRVVLYVHDVQVVACTGLVPRFPEKSWKPAMATPPTPTTKAAVSDIRSNHCGASVGTIAAVRPSRSSRGPRFASWLAGEECGSDCSERSTPTERRCRQRRQERDRGKEHPDDPRAGLRRAATCTATTRQPPRALRLERVQRPTRGFAEDSQNALPTEIAPITTPSAAGKHRRLVLPRRDHRHVDLDTVDDERDDLFDDAIARRFARWADGLHPVGPMVVPGVCPVISDGHPVRVGIGAAQSRGRPSRTALRSGRSWVSCDSPGPCRRAGTGGMARQSIRPPLPRTRGRPLAG